MGLSRFCRSLRGLFSSSSSSRRRPDQTAGSASPPPPPPPPPFREVFFSSSSSSSSSGRPDKSAGSSTPPPPAAASSSSSSSRRADQPAESSTPPPPGREVFSSSSASSCSSRRPESPAEVNAEKITQTENGGKFICLLGARDEEVPAQQAAPRNTKHKKIKPLSIIGKFQRKSENQKSHSSSGGTSGARDHESSVSRRLDVDKEEKILNSPRNNSQAKMGVASTCKECNRQSRVTLAMLMAFEDLFREETPYRGEEKEFGVGVCVPGPVNSPSGSPLFAQHSDSLFPASPCPLSSSSPCPPSLYVEGSCSKSDGAENTSNVPMEMEGTTSGREEHEVTVDCTSSSSESLTVEQPSGPSLSGDPRSDGSLSRTPSSVTLMGLSLRLLEHSLSLSSLSLSLSCGPLDAEAAAIEVAKASDKAEEAAKATREAASEASVVEAVVEAF